jgi:hypothetical protein
MRLKMEIFPADSFDVLPFVEELLRCDLLRAFSAQGQSWWWVTGFLKHQKIDKPTLKYPQPFGEDSAITRRAVGDSSPPEGKGREGKGMEEEPNGPTSAAQPSARAVAPAKVFRPPTLQEVRDYCRERKNSVDPQIFLDHYTSNGWRVGRNAMKDWRAAVRTWERNGINAETKQSGPDSAKNYLRDLDARVARTKAEAAAQLEGAES